MDFNLTLNRKENIVLLRPGISESNKSILQQYIHDQRVTNSLFIASSGTTAGDEVKVFEISHEMMLGHAEQICSHFDLNTNVNYINCLPTYFMGGVSVLYRKFVSGFNLMTLDKWDVQRFLDASKQVGGDCWSSLVPTQLEDIYQKDYNLCHFKGLFIGGDRLTQMQYNKGIAQSDPLYETYGASEFCSQIATSHIQKENRFIELLPFSKIKNINDKSYVNSQFHFNKIHIIKNNNIKTISYESEVTEYGYPINDKIEISDNRIKVLGRTDDFIKINGKFVSLVYVQSLISSKLNLNEADFFLSATHHERNGSQINLITTKEISLDEVKEVYPKVSNIKKIDHFLYNKSGKLIRNINTYISRGAL